MVRTHSLSSVQLIFFILFLLAEGFDVDSWNNVVEVLERTESTPSAWLVAVFVSSLISTRPKQVERCLQFILSTMI